MESTETNDSIPEEEYYHGEYALCGFWWRALAYTIDTVIIVIAAKVIIDTLDIRFPLPSGITLSSGAAGAYEYMQYNDSIGNFISRTILSLLYFPLFWWWKAATPGKMLCKIKIITEAGIAPSIWQAIGRYLGMGISFLVLCLGVLWVLFDKNKQGWHDKMAGTYVVRKKKVDYV